MQMWKGAVLAWQLPALLLAQLRAGEIHVGIKTTIAPFLCGNTYPWSPGGMGFTHFLKPRNLESKETCPVAFYINGGKKRCD